MILCRLMQREYSKLVSTNVRNMSNKKIPKKVDQDALPTDSFRDMIIASKNTRMDPKEKVRYPEHYLMICKNFESIHTASMPGCQNTVDKTVEDMVMRRFIHGCFLNYLASPIIIKRRLNKIIISFYVYMEKFQVYKVQQIYFLVGLTERLLQQSMGCMVQLEIRYSPIGYVKN
ncbi:28S ribosomal protein S24-A, mitochondrial [Thelohanellus kitauei]|uniref:28S ribosomal protein S24-A, mitochondrial n=1 Tax=Thelohanellus kitauei TaxID=669202 RepID=A0A0C2MS31_THEKT|nr:28S ribosomal protein S24-A, mitochondrial [Thelohanellus kitauei]